MLTADLDFSLPESRIATTPAEPRDAARLMVCHRGSGAVEHRHVRDLPQLGILQPGDLMVVNQTRVLPAYLQGVRTATGGRVTGLYVDRFPPADPTESRTTDQDPAAERWAVMLESGGRLQPGDTIDLAAHGQDAATARLHLEQALGRGRWRVRVESAGPVDPPTLLHRVGQTPLPPYIRRARQRLGLDPSSDADGPRYNTVFARGQAAADSVAAPTAGLHFTPQLLDRLQQRGVRRAAVDLRVGLGTFLPIQTDQLDEHPMHAESIEVSGPTLDALRDTRAHGGSVLAVGTTSVRALESLPHPLGDLPHYAAQTDLFITPDRVARGEFAFRWTDRLLTNFHLPRSTLLAMVAALPGVGLPRLKDWYAQAIAEQYRFYSYGDAMLIV